MSQSKASALEECAPRRCASFGRELTCVVLCLSELARQSCLSRSSFPAEYETAASPRPDTNARC